MAKLHSNLKKYDPHQTSSQALIGEKNYDAIHPLGTSAVKQRDATKAAEDAAKQAQVDADKPAIPLPDEEELARLRRRKGRGGGRAATVLTDDNETLG